jgi:hypothetical protein
MAGLITEHCFLDYVRLVSGRPLHYSAMLTQSHHSEICPIITAKTAYEITTHIDLYIVAHIRLTKTNGITVTL